MGTGLNGLTATRAIELIRSGEISSTELMESCLTQIERLEPRVKAWVCLNREGALEQARLVDEKIRSGERVGRLCGVPIGVKDIFNTIEMPTAMGSPIWKGFTPGNDARVVSRLKLQDGIMLGKTVTAEFAVHYNDITANPHNYEHSPGTSSSGSAAAVAASMVPIGLGTQTAGSAIRPASYCGIFGFKPSFGLVPRTGTLKTTDSLDTISFLCRGADDLGLVFDIARVHGPDYPISHRLLNDETRQSPIGSRWKIALVRGPKWECAEEYAKKALLELARSLSAEKQLIVEEVELGPEFGMAHEIHQTIYDKALAYYFKEEFKQKSLVSEMMYEIIERGNRLTLNDYLDGLERQSRLARQLDGLFGGYDIILTLSTGGEAPRGLTSPDRPDSCLIWTLCGVPAINLPVFRGPKRLPFGAQVVARRYNDILLLRMVKKLQEMGYVDDVGYSFAADAELTRPDSKESAA
ncbi:MAG: amidase [Firmicutes bacterium]|nr:amidase [Bacillota bacterium]